MSVRLDGRGRRPIFNSYAEFFTALLVITVLALVLIWLLLWHPQAATSRGYCPPGQVLVTTPDGIGRCSR